MPAHFLNMLLRYGHAPYTTKDTQLLEKVQKFALRVCTSNYNMNYDELDLLDFSHVPGCFFVYVLFTILFMVLYSSHLIYSLIYVTLAPTTL